MTNILKKIFKTAPVKKTKKKNVLKVSKKVTKKTKIKTVKVSSLKAKKDLKKTKIKAVKISSLKAKKDLKKTGKNLSPEKAEIKTDNLRISKSNEIKPEIIKVKKQTTEKREYKVKDHVVYPKHGVGQITDFKKINIGGIDVETYVLKFEKDKADGMVPVNKQSHLRPLATINQVNKCITILKSKPKIKRSMWSRRAQNMKLKFLQVKFMNLLKLLEI